MIGSLSHLVRAAALTAVLERSEKIDQGPARPESRWITPPNPTARVRPETRVRQPLAGRRCHSPTAPTWSLPPTTRR